MQVTMPCIRMRSKVCVWRSEMRCVCVCVCVCVSVTIQSASPLVSNSHGRIRTTEGGAWLSHRPFNTHQPDRCECTRHGRPSQHTTQ